MHKLKYLSLVGLMLLFISDLEAQESKIYNRNGQKFRVHIIEKGNTFYGISRNYSISIEDLKKHNPHLINELPIGDTLFIPLDKINSTDIRPTDIDNSSYLTYIVQEKNTLYSIAKEYNVDIKDIVLANPKLQEGMKIGMELRIPLAQLRDDTKSPKEATGSFLDYETHIVEPKETLYSLSKKYNVKIDSILSLNHGLSEGLKTGQEIILPIKKEQEFVGDFEGVEFDSSRIKKSYEIALLLPFYLDKIQEPSDSTDYAFLEDAQLMFKHAKYGIEFYEGFMLALDSIRNNGLSANLHVYDAANDTAKIRRIIEKHEMKNMDLIIGPLFFEEFMIAADFAKKQKINIISPVKQSNKILLGNEYVSKVISSEPALIRSLASFTADSLMNRNVVVVYSDNVKERINLEQFNTAYAKVISERKDTGAIYNKPTIFKWEGSDSFQSLKNKLIADSTGSRKNYLIVLSNNQAMVTQLLTSLYNIHQAYDISVIGLEDWEDYSNLDISFLHKLNVHLILPEFVDDSNKNSIDFRNKFFNNYESLPGKFAYLGYDVGYYYLSLLNRYGTNIRSMYDRHKFALLSRSFDFAKTGIESGYENRSYNLVKYEDYKLIKVK